LLLAVVPAFGWLATGVAHADGPPACTVTLAGAPTSPPSESTFAQGVAVNATCSNLQAQAGEVHAMSEVAVDGLHLLLICSEYSYGASMSGGPYNFSQGAEGGGSFEGGTVGCNLWWTAAGVASVVPGGTQDFSKDFAPGATGVATYETSGLQPYVPGEVDLVAASFDDGAATITSYVGLGVAVIAALVLVALGVGVLQRYLKRAADAA
jgi:hypothetical protein